MLTEILAVSPHYVRGLRGLEFESHQGRTFLGKYEVLSPQKAKFLTRTVTASFFYPPDNPPTNLPKSSLATPMSIDLPMDSRRPSARKDKHPNGCIMVCVFTDPSASPANTSRDA